LDIDLKMALSLAKGASLIGNASVFKGTSIFSQITTGMTNPIGATRDGSSLKDIRMRMKTIKNVQKITKTMKLIANARLKEAQNRMLKTRPFIEGSTRLFKDVPVNDGKNHLIIAVSSDRGLCGAINSSVVRFTRLLAKAKEEKGAVVSIISLGDKGTGQLSRDLNQKLTFSASEIGNRPPGFNTVGLLVDKIFSLEFESATLIFNYFISLIAYKTTTKELPGLASLVKNRNVFDNYDFEDDAQEFHMRDALEFYYGTTLYNALYESSASELAGRMTSMDNASRNAGDLLRRLSISYNRRRQASITTELTEIISGAAAVSN